MWNSGGGFLEARENSKGGVKHSHKPCWASAEHCRLAGELCGVWLYKSGCCAGANHLPTPA